jgi:hypothetical protein
VATTKCESKKIKTIKDEGVRLQKYKIANSLRFKTFNDKNFTSIAMNSLLLSPFVELQNVVVTGLFDRAFENMAVSKLPPCSYAIVTSDRTLNPTDDKGLALQTIDGLFAGRIALRETKLLPLPGEETAHVIHNVLQRAEIPELSTWSHLPVHIIAYTQEESTRRPTGYLVTIIIHAISLPEFRNAVVTYLESKFFRGDHGGVVVRRLDIQPEPERFTVRKRAAFETGLGTTNPTPTLTAGRNYPGIPDNSSEDTD